MTDPRRSLMRVVSPDKVWRLCEVVEGSDGGLPRLKAHISIFKALGISQAGCEAIVAVLDGNDAHSLSSVPSVRNCRPLHVLNSDGFEVRRYCPRAPHGPRPPTVTRGLSLTGEVCLASWNVCGMFVAPAHDRERYRGKLRMLRQLIDRRNIRSRQETQGHNEDLGEVLRLFPDCSGCGTCVTGRNSGCFMLLVRKAFLTAATSVVAMLVASKGDRCESSSTSSAGRSRLWRFTTSQHRRKPISLDHPFVLHKGHISQKRLTAVGRERTQTKQQRSSTDAE